MLIAKYLGQPNPFCQHLAGRFFGGNATPLDVVWSKLIIRIITWRRSYKTSHYSLQHLIQDMMRLGNIESVIEAVNFFHGKVG